MKKTHTIADLKVICNALNVSTSGNKAALFMRIRDCSLLLYKLMPNHLCSNR
jgi:hypothetical protein